MKVEFTESKEYQIPRPKEEFILLQQLLPYYQKQKK
jgi:hypothetical protein